MIESALIGIFCLGYLAITLEHNIKIDKAASALLTGVVCWVLVVFNADTLVNAFPDDSMLKFNFLAHGDTALHFFTGELRHHLGEIAEILFFLLGAMTVVELIDAHDGFQLITSRIRTRKKTALMWIISLLSFFLSAVLDNLTTTIVMVSLLRKLIDSKEDRWLFAGLVIIAANAGGAWSPIGDVTTTMLWIGGQITAGSIIPSIFIESVVCLAVPLLVLQFKLKGDVQSPPKIASGQHGERTTERERLTVFALGIGCLVFVPIFKTATHLPPYMGMLFGLGVLWLTTEILHRKKNTEEKAPLSVVAVIRKIDTPSILFFLGILIAIGALQSAGTLVAMATGLQEQLNDINLIAIAIGGLSAIVDNVPLVAASMGMYEVSNAAAVGDWNQYFVQDGYFWHLLAYCSGTGGSMLIIGSAAGVAAMGLEKITFGWYLKHMSLLALLGYLAGAAVFIAIH
ncbi:MAG TPA: sodium:proton antiporter NhaD [Luteibaculaceae bacterium]|nr:sodium:proton antiporter NhaD [Luteibaculaceae bacterium]